MRKRFITAAILFFLFFQINNSCLAKGCHHMYDVLGDSLYNQGDTINTTLRVSSWGDCGTSGNCTFSNFQWYRNGTALGGQTNYQYAATDTGLYYVEYNNGCTGLESTSFHIAYYGTSTYTNDLDPKKSSPFISAVGSSLFRINMCGKKLKHLLLSDNSGRLILSITNAVTEINLGNFSQGIYYYTIFDEDKNVWRGKIFKQ